MNTFPRRLIYFSIGFVLPALMILCSTVAIVASPSGSNSEGLMVGTGLLTAFCVFTSQAFLYNDAAA